MDLRIGILTISDRAYNGIYEDLSGVALREALDSHIDSKWSSEYRLVCDEEDLIKNALIELSEICSLIFTTGGSGPSKRDVTPEVMMNLCHKILPGFGEIMRVESFKKTPTAILSRQLAGIYDDSLIVNFPGNPNSIKECMPLIIDASIHCVGLLSGIKIKLKPRI